MPDHCRNELSPLEQAVGVPRRRSVCDARNLHADSSESRLALEKRVCGFWWLGLWEAVGLPIAEWKLCPGVTAKTHQKPHIRAGSVLSVLPVESGRLHFIHHLFPSGGLSQRAGLESLSSCL